MYEYIGIYKYRKRQKDREGGTYTCARDDESCHWQGIQVGCRRRAIVLCHGAVPWPPLGFDP